MSAPVPSISVDDGEEQSELAKEEQKLRIEDARYTRDHPELVQMVQLYLQHVIQTEPADVAADAQAWFCADDLREKVERAMQA